MNRAFFIEKYQRVGLEGLIGFALAADVNQFCAVLALQLIEERLR
jgi:hypothetical protein